MNQPSSSFEDLAKLEYDAAVQSSEALQAGPEPIPAIGEFAGRLALLEPFYAKMERNGWEPAVEFYARGLDLQQSSRLLAGYDLGDGLTSEGVSWGWEGHWRTLRDPVAEQTGVKFRVGEWDVAVTSDADEPPLAGVSADGQHGPGAEQAVTAIRDLLDDGSSLGEAGSEYNQEQLRLLVARANPTIGAYNGLQLRRLAASRQPVDYSENLKTKSLLRPTVHVRTGKKVVTGYWHQARQVVSFGYLAFGHREARVGVRPSVSAGDLPVNQPAE